MSFILSQGLLIGTVCLSLLLIGSILQQDRAPSSTLAWLLFILVVPYLGIPLYMMIGGRKLRRIAAGKSNLRHQVSPLELEQETDVVARLLLSSGVARPSDGNKLQLLATGESAFNALIRALRSAEHSIAISTFIFKSDSVGEAIAAELITKAKAGVKVRVLIDSFGESLDFTKRLFKKMRREGVEVRFFMPIFPSIFRGYANLRNHRKVVLIDGHFAIAGGMNFAQEYMGPTPDPGRWHDLGVAVSGAAVADLYAIFKSDWEFAGGTLGPQEFEAVLQQDVSSTANANTQSRIQVVGSGPDTHDDLFYDALLTAIYHARESIQIVTPYFVPDESTAKALELAARRGVNVEILVPNRSNHRLADLAGASYLRQVERAGAQIYRHPAMVHAKMTVVDQRYAIVGSANMDIRSMLLNYELSLFLYSQPDLAQLQYWWLTLRHEAASGLREVGRFKTMLQGAGRVLAPML